MVPIDPDCNTVAKSILALKAKIASIRTNKHKKSKKKIKYAAHYRRKRKLYLSQKGRCCFCTNIMMLDTSSTNINRIATFEHVIPKYFGGTNEITNLKISCHACNKAGGHMDFDEFLIKRRSPEYEEILEKERPVLERNMVKKNFSIFYDIFMEELMKEWPPKKKKEWEAKQASVNFMIFFEIFDKDIKRNIKAAQAKIPIMKKALDKSFSIM